MAIKRNANTGEHFISAPIVRSTRQRYEKTPLVSGRRGLFGKIADFFRGDQRFFAASAIADRIDRGLQVAKSVKRGRSNCAPGTTLFLGISDQLRQHNVDAYVRADNEHDQINTHLRQEEAWLDQARPKEILDELETNLETHCTHLHTEIMPLAEEFVTTSIRLERFRTKHNLTEEEKWGRKLDLAVFGQVGILLLVEFIANSIFQADTQKTGLIGGVLIAALTSIVTIILGVMFGVGFQRIRMRGFAGRGIGSIWLALAFLLSFIFVSLLSLIRIAGESGHSNPILFARLQLGSDPIAGLRAMLDLPAFAYTLCITTLIVVVALKYLQYFGSFPELRHWFIAFVDADEEFDGAYEDELDDLKDIVLEQSEKLEKAPSFIASCKIPIMSLVEDHENVVEQHMHDVADVRGAGKLFSAFIKEHGEATGDNAQLPTPEDEILAHGYLSKMAGEHQAIVERASQLCSRDDVSEESVARARDELNDLVEKKLEEFSRERDEILDAALTKYKKDRSWLKDVVETTSRQAAVPPID